MKDALERFTDERRIISHIWFISRLESHLVVSLNFCLQSLYHFFPGKTSFFTEDKSDRRRIHYQSLHFLIFLLLFTLKVSEGERVTDDTCLSTTKSLYDSFIVKIILKSVLVTGCVLKEEKKEGEKETTSNTILLPLLTKESHLRTSFNKKLCWLKPFKTRCQETDWVTVSRRVQKSSFLTIVFKTYSLRDLRLEWWRKIPSLEDPVDPLEATGIKCQSLCKGLQCHLRLHRLHHQQLLFTLRHNHLRIQNPTRIPCHLLLLSMNYLSPLPNHRWIWVTSEVTPTVTHLTKSFTLWRKRE